MLRFNRHDCCRLRDASLLQCRRFSYQRKRSPYEVLSVPTTANRADIKKSYIDKAKMCHPDLFPNDDEKKAEFQEIQEAYEVLTDKKKRAQLFHQNRVDNLHRQQRYRKTYDTRQNYGRRPKGSEDAERAFKEEFVMNGGRKNNISGALKAERTVFASRIGKLVAYYIFIIFAFHFYYVYKTNEFQKLRALESVAHESHNREVIARMYGSRPSAGTPLDTSSNSKYQQDIIEVLEKLEEEEKQEVER